MPERIYRDLTPDFTDVPADTWKDADVGWAVEDLTRQAGLELGSVEAESIGLIDLARLANARDAERPLPERLVSFLEEHNPDLLQRMESSRELRGLGFEA